MRRSATRCSRRTTTSCWSGLKWRNFVPRLPARATTLQVLAAGGAAASARSAAAAVMPPASHDLTARAELGRALEMLESELAMRGWAASSSRCVSRRLPSSKHCVGASSRQQPAFLAALADAPVRASLALIHGAPNRAWRVNELAAAAGLSRAAFAERFHKRVGDAASALSARVAAACRSAGARLERRPVREVAKRAGYRSTSGFSRAFRRFFGHSPGNLRRSVK